MQIADVNNVALILETAGSDNMTWFTKKKLK